MVLFGIFPAGAGDTWSVSKLDVQEHMGAAMIYSVIT
jgi:hypothetical protein